MYNALLMTTINCRIWSSSSCKFTYLYHVNIVTIIKWYWSHITDPLWVCFYCVMSNNHVIVYFIWHLTFSRTGLLLLFQIWWGADLSVEINRQLCVHLVCTEVLLLKTSPLRQDILVSPCHNPVESHFLCVWNFLGEQKHVLVS